MIKNIDTVIELAKISRATYADPIDHYRLTIDKEILTHQKVVHGAYNRGFCRVFWNKKTSIIAFRGSKYGSDWTQCNFKMLPRRLKIASKNKLNIRVHHGFQKALYYKDRTTGLLALDAILKHIDDNDLMSKDKIYITGHSLGGAIGKIFLCKLYELRKKEFRKRKYDVVLFGAPAAGFTKFREYFDDNFKRVTRIVNGADVVPFMPPVAYRHIGKEIWLNPIKPDKNIGWKKRFAFAFKVPISFLFDDHSIHSYIKKLEEHDD